LQIYARWCIIRAFIGLHNVSRSPVITVIESHFVAILKELKSHAPFTATGALTGIVCMLAFRNAEHSTVHAMFQVFHPAHVVLSALATASLFKLRKGRKHVLAVLLVGYFGSIGVATLSDCVLPFFGETILGVAVPRHDHAHETESESGHEHEGEVEHVGEAGEGIEHANEPNEGTGHGEADERDREHAGETGHASHGGPKIHLGFIEEWYIVNPAALLGVLIAYLLPRTRFSHAGHVLVSTWASSFHILMNTQAAMTPIILAGVFVVLFIAVWLPCCISDIVFPMLFISPREAICSHHGCKH